MALPISFSSCPRNLTLALVATLTSLTLLLPSFAQALPFDITPIPSSFDFPKGGNAFYEGKIYPKFSAINDAGLVIGTEPSIDNTKIGVILWDAINSEERGTAVLDVSAAAPPESSPSIYVNSSLSSDGQILILAEIYYKHPVKLLAFRGTIDSLASVTLPVSEFASLSHSSPSATGERLITFEQYSLSGDSLLSAYWISPSSNFVSASVNLSLKDRVSLDDRYYFIDRQQDTNSQSPGYLFRVFDRTGVNQQLSFISSVNPIGISQDLTVLQEKNRKLILQSLTKNTKGIVLPGFFSRADAA